jgi:MFS family permease
LSTTDLQTQDSSVKTWRAGTLIYTSGGLVILFAWLLWGDFAWSMKERVAGPVFTIVLKKFHGSDTLLGTLTGSLPAAINIFMLPIICVRSDRHRGRWGRRIPYLLATTPIAALSMVGLALSPKLGLATNSSVLAFLGLFWVLFEIGSLTANQIFGAFVNDVVPHSLMGRFYGLFRALSLIAGILFNFYLIGKAHDHYIPVFVGTSILYGVGMVMMCMKVREGEYPAPAATTEPQSPFDAFWRAAALFFAECFSQPYYVWVFLAWTFCNVAFIPVNLFSIPYAHSVAMSDTTYGHYIALTYAISLGLSYFLGVFCDWFHPLRVSIVAMVLYAVCALWGAMYANDARTYGIGLVAHGVLSGTFFTTSASLCQRLFPRNRFAQFAAAAGMLGAVTQVIVGPSVGAMLDHNGHIYRYVFHVGLGLTIIGTFCLAIVHNHFMKLGGPKHYVAPE